MAEAADFEGQGGEFDCRRIIAGGKPAGYFLEHCLVLADQPPFGSPFLGAAEDVERCAAPPAELRKKPKGGEHPRPVGLFAQMPALGIALGEQRRSEMEMQLVGPLELVGDALQEMAFGI